jgi:hypothetical protein
MFVISVEYIQLAVDCRVYVVTVSSPQVKGQQLTFPNLPHYTNPWWAHHNEYSEKDK